MAESALYPVLFRGGVASDYKIVEASTGTLMSRHIPSGAQRLGVRAGATTGTPGLSRVGGALGALNAVTGAVSAVASAYGAYEARRTRQETEYLRSEVSDLHLDLHRGFASLHTAVRAGEGLLATLEESVRAEGTRTRWEVVRSREMDLEARWRNLSNDWEAFLDADSARVDLAQTLRITARDFVNRLTLDLESREEMRHAAAAPYLFAAHLAAAQALHAMGEPTQAAKQIQRLEAVLNEIGGRSIAGMRLFEVHANREAVMLLWGLHEQSKQLAAALRDGSPSMPLLRPVPELPSLPMLPGLEDFSSTEGLTLDQPIPVTSLADVVAVGRMNVDLAAPEGPHVPTVRAALNSMGLEDTVVVAEPIDGEVLMAVLADEHGGLAAIRQDFGIVQEVEYPEPSKTVLVPLDWPAVVEYEVAASRAEVEDERSAEAVGRLEQLILFLGVLVEETAPETYEKIIFRVRRHILKVMWLHFMATGEGRGRFTEQFDALIEDVASLWPCPREVGFLALLELKERAINDDRLAVRRLLQELSSTPPWQVDPTDLAAELYELAKWGEAELVYDVLKKIIDEKPSFVPERDLWGARLYNAEVQALTGDRKGARGKVNRLIAVIETAAPSPDTEVLLARARQVADSMRRGTLV